MNEFIYVVITFLIFLRVQYLTYNCGFVLNLKWALKGRHGIFLKQEKNEGPMRSNLPNDQLDITGDVHWGEVARASDTWG